MSADNGGKAGEREKTIPEEKRNTDNGSDTAPSAGERNIDTDNGSDTAPSAGKENIDTDDGLDTAPSAGERYIDTGDGSDTLSSTKSIITETSRDLPDSGRPAADVDYSQTENLGSDQREGHPETEDDGQEQKAPDADSPSSGAGSSGNNGDKSVGFVCCDQNPDIMSLINRLSPDIGPGRPIPGSPEYENVWPIVDGFSPVIMFCRSQTPPSSLRRFLDFCSRTHGTEEMMMVVTDLEDTASERRKHSEWRSGGFPRCLLVTLTETEMDVICTSDREDMSAERRMARKVTRMRQILQSAAAERSQSSSHPEQDGNKLLIGIFYREEESQYSWLELVLTSHIFGGCAPEVRPCSISNSGFQKFFDDDSQCKFGILYDSKNRGRINVTDVTDSLYDEKLEYLSSKLGKKNLIVVIDDLDDSSDHRKTQIHKDHPSIREKTEELFLISREEKTSNYHRRLLVDRRRAEEKLQKVKDEIIKRKTEVEKLRTATEERTNPEKQQDAGSGDGGQTSSGSSWDEVDNSPSDTDEGEKSGNNANDGSEDGGDDNPVPGAAVLEIEKPPTKTEVKENPERQQDAGSADGGQTSDIFSWGKQFLQSMGSSMTSLALNSMFGFPWPKSVGIFSRSSDSEYSWLKMLLESPDISNIKAVHSCYISNTGFSRFCYDVSRCTFGILYHSKNRGRVNVTDVTDSLYDEELEYLSSRLGKKNVVVVIDDLNDDGDAIKDKLLSSQPKIKTLAQDLILVRSASPEEKKKRARNALKKVLH